MAVLSTSTAADPNPGPAILDRLQLLWDTMAEFEVAQGDEALDHLLFALIDLLGADRAGWYAAVRLPQGAGADPLQGWHPRLFRARAAGMPSGEAELPAEHHDIAVKFARGLAFGGKLRTQRLADVSRRESVRARYGCVRDYTDALWVVCPVNPDIEVHFSFWRGPDRPPFTDAERDLAAAALSSLRWFHRQYLLSHGLLVASAPLTAVEREVLSGLLSAMSEREIAAAHGRTLNTTHEYVKTIYRKFNVKSRAALMALWLGSLG